MNELRMVCPACKQEVAYDEGTAFLRCPHCNWVLLQEAPAPAPAGLLLGSRFFGDDQEGLWSTLSEWGRKLVYLLATLACLALVMVAIVVVGVAVIFGGCVLAGMH